jgi:hypothetical protein
MIGNTRTVRYRSHTSKGAENSFFRTVSNPMYRSRNGRTKKAGILDSGLVDHELVAGVRFELTTFGL